MPIELTPALPLGRQRAHRRDLKAYQAAGVINREELAWAAGFFDGEGNVGCQVKYHTATFRMNVSQVRLEPLQRFQAAVLGLGVIRRRQRESSTHHGTRPIYEFRTGGYQETQAVMAMLAPFLCLPKREQLVSAMITYRQHYAQYE